MKEIKLGRTNLQVSRVGIGGIPIQRPPEKQAIEIIKHALDKGINIIDTAIAYGDSEKRIGKALVGRREDVILITRTWSVDKQVAAKHLKESLRNLQTDYIDVWQFHNISTMEEYDKLMIKGSALEVANEAKREGKIRFMGITGHNIEVMIKAVESELFDVILFPFNFVNNEPTDNLVSLTMKLDIGFTAMKPFAGGRLTNANLVMKYLMQFDNVVPVPGVERKEEIDEIVDIVNGSWEITEKEKQQMEKIRKELGTSFCQWCGYCMPGCPQKISIPSVINIKVIWDLWPHDVFESRKKRSIEIARTCIECGKCEEKCPYNLPIRKMLVESIKFYESKIIEKGN